VNSKENIVIIFIVSTTVAVVRMIIVNIVKIEESGSKDGI